MIFVTVGTQLSFDRLVKSIDKWSKSNNYEIFAQIGPSEYIPINIKYSDFLAPDLADEMFRKATLIVSHAGMGSILTALKYRKPILIMPRNASLGEHRNEHQFATAKWLGNKSGIYVAWDESQLISMLNNHVSLESGEAINDYASPQLIENIKKYINSL